MTIQAALKKQQQALARLERQLAVQKLKKRKTETRRKIELGGLVIKAKLDRYSKAVILGALMDVLENLAGDNEGMLETWYHSKGEAAFMGYGPAPLKTP